MADYASEAGHFYRRDGSPCYTIEGANGIERNTTLRDARRLDLVPGVTTIIRCAAAPGLEVWKQEQMMLASLTLPKRDGETEKDWLARIRMDAKEQAKNAAERGTEIHGALERSKQGKSVAPQYVPWVGAAHAELASNCGAQSWKAEQSYAHRFGYGCKIDLHSSDWVIDYKGKDDATREECYLYDEHYMQLAACRLAAGIPEARCAIVFFGRQSPWAKFVEAPAEELRRGWDMYESLLSYWQSKNRIGQ